MTYRSYTPLIIIVLLFGFSLNAFSQTLADAAKRERERQKKATSKVVITGSGKTGTSSTQTGPTAAPSTQTTAAKPFQITDNKGRDEKYWRTAFEAGRADLKRAEDKAQVADLHIKDLNTQMLRQSDVYNREYRIGEQITLAQKELDDARRDVELAKKKISDLEDELRRSNGPAGWAR